MSDLLWVQETYVNQTEDHIFGESDVYETWTDNRGQLFRELQREYGRCASRVYIDTTTGTKTTGWVFEKRMAYEDSPSKFYVREVWVTLHESAPTRTEHYAYADA